ncbi:MAG: ATP synthase F0 subunit B [Acidobacteria bacterium]|nr:MAG: ATP synthase F0 subunit B [Acidobacteriota bacterium]
MTSGPLAVSMALAAAEAGGEGNPLLRVTPGLWLWTVLIFLLLLAVLYRFGWGMLIEKLDQRDRSIRGAIEEARREREEAAKLLAEHERLLAETRRKTAEMVAEAQREAKSERQRILAEARAEYDKTIERGRQQIEQETRAAVAEIRRQAAELAIEVTRRMLPELLDAERHRALAEKFVSEL